MPIQQVTNDTLGLDVSSLAPGNMGDEHWKVWIVDCTEIIHVSESFDPNQADGHTLWDFKSDNITVELRRGIDTDYEYLVVCEFMGGIIAAFLLNSDQV